MTHTLEETEAAELEGLVAMPEDLIPLRHEYLSLKDQIDNLNERKNEIRETFGARLMAEGLQGYVLNGKVHARKSEVTNTTVDSKRLKVEMPHVWKQFIRVTKSVRITVN